MAGKSPSPCSLSFSFSLLTSVSFSQQPRAGQVASLQMLSARRLSECLTPANCLSVLAVAEDLRATPLVRTTLDYLSSHLVEVVGASGHELFSLSTRSLADVLSRDKLSLVSEYWAFLSVLLTWQGQGGGTAEDLWEFIRWPLMSSSELERVEALRAGQPDPYPPATEVEDVDVEADSAAEVDVEAVDETGGTEAEADSNGDDGEADA